MNEDDLFISIIDEGMEKRFFETEIDFNIELALFSLPRILEGDLDDTTAKVAAILNKHPIRKAMHGPVMDLYYDSRDPKIVDVARMRTAQGITIASKICAEIMVVHSTFNPLNVSKKYPGGWVERSTAFWSEMVKMAEREQVKIVFENIWDPHPGFIKEVITNVDSPCFKACVDVGHLNIFSRVPIPEWIEGLDADLAYVHLHNNYQMIDDHNGLDDGTFDFETFFTEIKNRDLHPLFTLELRSAAAVEPSKKLLQQWMG